MSHQTPTNNNSSSLAAPAADGSEASNAQGQQFAIGPPQDPRGGLYAPGLHGGNIPDNSTATVVARLMNPPWPFRNPNGLTVTITITWAVGVVGPERFERRFTYGRNYLSEDDELREHGVAAGLAPEILEWLIDGHERLTLPVEKFNLQPDH